MALASGRSARASCRVRRRHADAPRRAPPVPRRGGRAAPPDRLAALPGLAESGFSLEGPGSVVQALTVLASIVFVHECGHFAAARRLGIFVTKFSVGFGPTLIAYKGAEVEYTLKALPLGGYVAFPDDDPESPIPPDDPDLLRNRPVLDRMIVVSAGVLANFAFAFGLLLAQVNTVGLVEPEYMGGVKVPELLRVSAARRDGVLPGDIIMSVNGREIGPDAGSVQALVSAIQDSPDTTLRFGVQRGRERVDVNVTPDRSPNGIGRIGVQLEANVKNKRRYAESAGEAVVLAGNEMLRLTKTVTDGLYQLASNFSKTAEQVTGPVAIVAVGAEVARTDLSGLYSFAAVVNLNLAVVNMLPLPALDGGSFVLLVVEAIRGGKKLPSTVENALNNTTLLLLLGVGTYLIFRDTVKLLPM